MTEILKYEHMSAVLFKMSFHARTKCHFARLKEPECQFSFSAHLHFFCHCGCQLAWKKAPSPGSVLTLDVVSFAWRFSEGAREIYRLSSGHRDRQKISRPPSGKRPGAVGKQLSRNCFHWIAKTLGVTGIYNILRRVLSFGLFQGHIYGIYIIVEVEEGCKGKSEIQSGAYLGPL